MSSHTAVDEASSSPATVSRSRRIPTPVGTRPRRIVWRETIIIGGFHMLAPLAFLPWLFSWTGVASAILGCFVFGCLGISLGYHRLLTHRSFTCQRWLEHTLAMLGVCCLEDTPARWVANHRCHHQHSDEQPDPHSPMAGFLWGHMGWLFVRNRESDPISMYERYARDLLKDPFYFRYERTMLYIWVNLVQWAVYFVAGAAIGWFSTGTGIGAVQMSLSLFIWGVVVRTVMEWHFTWSVNSLSHVFGYRNYDTSENSRNNWLVAIVSHGEGWHNNHHADPRSAAHGHRWWEFDLTYRTICLLKLLGLADDVIPIRAAEPADSGVPAWHRQSAVEPPTDARLQETGANVDND
jgi:stearoyl-CoA desaturase (delta-9 desaturase)